MLQLDRLAYKQEETVSQAVFQANNASIFWIELDYVVY